MSFSTTSYFLVSDIWFVGGFYFSINRIGLCSEAASEIEINPKPGTFCHQDNTSV